MVFILNNLRNWFGFTRSKLDNPANMENTISPVVVVGKKLRIITKSIAISAVGDYVLLEPKAGQSLRVLAVNVDDGSATCTFDALKIDNMVVATKTAANNLLMTNSDLPYIAVCYPYVLKVRCNNKTANGNAVADLLVEESPDA